MPQFPATIALSGLSAADGFKIIGEAGSDYAGLSVSPGGDINGDGFADLIIGAPYNSAGGNAAGAAYVVFGTKEAVTAVNLADVAAGTGGFKIIGEAAVDFAGYSVSAAGDLNRDGFSDLIVGAFRNGGNYAGAAYVVYGSAAGTNVNLDDVAQGIGGFEIIGEQTRDYAGVSVSEAGDVNGDGFDDLIIGADRNDANGNNAGDYTGAAYVVFGTDEVVTAVNLAAVAAGTGGFKINGEANEDFTGRSVSSAGDVNGDGLADLIVGARNDAGGYNSGAAYVVFGKASNFSVDLAALGSGGFKIIGETAFEYAGQSVSSAGDVNGDGFADLIIGAKGNDAGGNYAGAAYVVFGKASDLSVNLAALGSGGFKIIGEVTGDTAGISVSSVGDVNGDGLADLIVGANQNDTGGYDAGAAYVLYGKVSGFSNVNLADVAQGIGGFKLVGEAAYDSAGRSVSSAGDFNGDGVADLIVGASRNDAGGNDAGAAYLIFGRAPDPVNRDGTNGPDTLRGAGGRDTLNGLDGDDTLVGFGGNDTLDGGEGGDLMKGGDGDDTYIVDAGRDRVIELADAGDDHVFASIHYSMDENIERLTLTGNRTLSAIGNELGNTIIGNDASNIIDGGLGADIMSGGRGDDFYTIDDAGDQLVGETSTGGIDTVVSLVNHTLGLRFENLMLLGSGDVDGTGNRFDNTIVGNDGGNILAGEYGNDVLQGGAGNDVFVFNTKLSGARNVDQIVDFVPGGDMIHLDNAVFTNLGAEGDLNPRMFATAAPQDANDRLLYNSATGALSYDADGSGAKAAVQFAQLGTGLALTAADFLIV